MKRTAIVVDVNCHSTVYIMVDIQAASVILPYVNEDKAAIEFKDIRELLKNNLRNKEKYKKADVSDKAKDIFEMRFMRWGRNDRIFCKEITVNAKRMIIMVELQKLKKTQGISKQYKGKIETMGSYEYNLLFE